MSMGQEVMEMDNAREITERVEERVKEMQKAGELDLPPNYSASNALRAAYLKLQETKDKNKRPVLESASKTSIFNSLFRMVQLGLNVSKEQGYFICYGNKLQFDPSYFGLVAVAKRMADVEDVYAQVIYQDDEIEYEIKYGRTVITKHKQTFESKASGKLKGAYATIVFSDERPDYTELMTLDEIKSAWKQGQYSEGGRDTVHDKFPARMALKTVIKRATRLYVNTSSDDHLFLEALNGNSAHEEQVNQEKEEKMADGDVIDINSSAKSEVEYKSDSEPENPYSTDKEPAPEKTSYNIHNDSEAVEKQSEPSEKNIAVEQQPESEITPPWEE